MSRNILKYAEQPRNVILQGGNSIDPGISQMIKLIIKIVRKEEEKE